MPVTVVVGGQFGSEGKGKVSHLIARDTGASVSIRVGGPNSGHTVVTPEGNAVILRQLPTASILPEVTCVLGAGSYVNPEQLLAELEWTGLTPDRLLIDPRAVVVTQADELREKESPLQRNIGSTQSGTGSAVLSRIARTGEVTFAESEPRLKGFVRPVVTFLRDRLKGGQRVLVEGTQGFGLSVLHSKYYPYVTSRDTTAAGFVSEAGLSPLDVDDVVVVLRAFPIRVSGNSGPLPDEITWDEVTAEAGSNSPIIEHTSVTKKVRRVARFHPEVVLQAIMVNRPTRVVLNHVDHVDASCRGADALSPKASGFVDRVELLIEHPIAYVGVGPSTMIARAKGRPASTSA
jgi:adenylosuccinate synthase